MSRFYKIIIAVIILINVSFAQFEISSQKKILNSNLPFIPDSAIVKKFNPPSQLTTPLFSAVGLNVLLGSFNYAWGSPFARISLRTIAGNFKTGWATDADAFLTNMFAHPFHGSIYYNLSRSSGFGFWHTLGISAFGSWQWEFFMENEPPAINDWIMTSYAGSMIGEMFYRYSNLILDESKSGTERVLREAAAGIFNPGRLFKRLITGRAFRINNLQLYEKRYFTGELSLGANNVADGTTFKFGQRSLLMKLNTVYGKLFNLSNIKPLDFIRFNLGLNLLLMKRNENFESQPVINQFRIFGILSGNVSIFKNSSRFLLGLFSHYDYLSNNVYQIGAASVGAGIGFRSPPKMELQFISIMHAAVVLMGGVNSDYALQAGVTFLDSARNYNMGPGLHFKTENLIKYKNASFLLSYSFWWIHTWDGALGDELIGMLMPQIRYNVYGKINLGIEYLIYHRAGLYDDYPNRYLQNNEARIFIGYLF
jgi:hypothetical protein